MAAAAVSVRRGSIVVMMVLERLVAQVRTGQPNVLRVVVHLTSVKMERGWGMIVVQALIVRAAETIACLMRQHRR